MQTKYEPWALKNEEDDMWGITIVEGKFKDLIIAFNSMNFAEDDQGVNLDYTLYRVPENVDKDIISEDPEFKNVLQYIVEDIIKKAIDEYENRKDNSPESSS